MNQDAVNRATEAVIARLSVDNELLRQAVASLSERVRELEARAAATAGDNRTEQTPTS